MSEKHQMSRTRQRAPARKRRVSGAPARAASVEFVRQAREYSSPACYLHELEPEMKASAPRGIRIKRVYEKPAAADGWRVLVDRLWPRGLRKDAAAVDEWARDIAPSTPLRKWLHSAPGAARAAGYDPKHWAEFQRRYRAELAGHAAQLQILRERAADGPVTLLYGARNPEMSHAMVLQEVLTRARRRARPAARRASRAKADARTKTGSRARAARR